jgi:hypothetical protein
MTRSTKTGFTILEVMIAIALLFTVILGSMWEFFRRSSIQTKELFEETGLAIEVERTFSVIEREVFNSAFFLAAEGLVSPGDGAYSGLATLNGGLASVATRLSAIDCTYEPPTAPLAADRYAVLRYTTINPRLFPERTRVVWRETALEIGNAAPDVLTTFVHATGSLFVFENGIKNVNEIYLQDADARFFRRYQVLSSERYEGPIDPVTGLAVPTTTFNYVKATLALPQTFTGSPVAIADQIFISSSSVYGANTKVTCVDSQGRLVQRSQYGTGPTASVVLMDPKGSGYKFESFAVSFANLKQDKNALIRNIGFYNWYANPQVAWQACLNVIKIQMSFTENATGRTKGFTKTFLINSKNLQRATACENMANP